MRLPRIGKPVGRSPFSVLSAEKTGGSHLLHRGAQAVYDTGFPEPIAGSSWRKRYQITAYLAPCDCFYYRVCGVWCDYSEIGIQPVKERGTSDHIIRQCDGD